MASLRTAAVVLLAVAGAALLGAACGGTGTPRFDPCEVGEPTLLESSDTDVGRSQHTLFADEDGYLLFWTDEYRPEENGVWAMRVGGSPVHLVATINGGVFLSVAEVTDGYLVCWADNLLTIGEPRLGACLVVDHDLAVVAGPARPANGVFIALGRIGTTLYAAQLPDVDDASAPPLLVPIDETGAPVGEGVTAPCNVWRRDRFTWAPGGIACLVPSDPLCGDQFNEPPDCTHHLQLFAGDGTMIFDTPDVAPFGWYSQEVQVHIAARTDGFLVSWFDNVGGYDLHARPVSSGGVAGTTVDVEANPTFGGGLAAIPGGYVATWSEDVPDVPGGYTLIRFLLVDSSGTPLAEPAWLVEAEGNLTRHYATLAAIGSAPGAGFGVAWEAAGGEGGSDYRTGLFFRAMGCPF